MAANTHLDRWVVLYDDDCGFCKWSLDKLLAWDRRGRLRAVAIQSDEGQGLLADLPAERRLDSMHLIDPQGELSSAGPALGPLARELPGGRPLGALLERFPRATARAYRWISDNRSRLGRLVGADASCELRR